jgi:phosphoglycerate kinase
MRSVKDMDVRNKRVLIRCDFNVPMKNGSIEDDSRIQATLPTLQYLLEQGARVVACSHLGKPKGERKAELSLAPVASRLGELLNREVHMAPDCIGPEVADQVAGLEPGQIMLLENLRFHGGETANEAEFSRQLAELADIYVNDAFGVVHRAHASVAGVTEHIDHRCAGLLLSKEVDYLTQATAQPEHPYVLISGGAKVSSKIGILTNLMDKVDRIIIGGAMANTFRKSQGYGVGSSKTEDDMLDQAAAILDKAKANRVSFYLPVDYVTGSDLEAASPGGVVPFQDVPGQEMILDTGPASHTLFSEVLKDAKTVVWNGPMGAFENPAFSQGSFGLAQTVAGLEATTIVGGGDTDSLIHKCGLQDKISFISTGGGSFLEYLEGKELPGLKAL